MRHSRLYYILAPLFLAVLFWLNMPGDGYRLPVYYMPDGEVIMSAEYYYKLPAQRIYLINGTEPYRADTLYSEKRVVEISTENGNFLVNTVPNNIWNMILDYKYFIIVSFVFLFSGLWFLESGKDLHLAVFCFACTIVAFALVMLSLTNTLPLLWMLTFFLIPPTLLNLGLRTSGREIPGALLLAEFLVQVLLSFISYVAHDYHQTFVNLRYLISISLFITFVVVISLQLDTALQRTPDPIERLKRWSLLFGMVFGFFLAYLLNNFRNDILPESHKYDIVFFVFMIFPLTLLYGTYRIQLVPFQLVLTNSIVAGLLTTILVSIYGLVLMSYYLFIPEGQKSSHWPGHLILLVMIVFFLDPIRRRISTYLQRNIFRLSDELTESLESLSRNVASPLHIQTSISQFIETIKTTLDLEKAEFLLNTDTLTDVKIKEDPFRHLKSESHLWSFMEPEQITVTSYLTYAGGRKGDFFNFLYDNRFYLSIGVHGPRLNLMDKLRRLFRSHDGSLKSKKQPPFQAALLIGYKKGNFIFKLFEIRFIQEAVRLMGMLIQNYLLLTQEVEKRRRMRELFLAGQVQKSFSISPEMGGDRLSFSAFSQPLITVTGDYLDMIKLKSDQFVILLGDVSGHGLGTGYLVSTFRSLIRSHLQSGASLTETIEILNQFLLERYRGEEFITLFAFVLNTSTGQLEYVNAAHPGPFLRKAENEEVIQLSNSQRLLGLMSMAYTSTIVELEPGDRIFLYSDGVTETFDDRERPFGEERLLTFIKRHGDQSLEKIKNRLGSTLKEFRGDNDSEDDITFLAVEYSSNGSQGIMREMESSSNG